MGQTKQRGNGGGSNSGGHARQRTNNASVRSSNGVHQNQQHNSINASSSLPPANFAMAGMLSSKLMLTFHVILAVICGVLYRNHIFNLKENEVHFSHLSDMEREMSFRTEMGFYYSYYKTLTDSPSFWKGIVDMTADNHTEYPDTINALQRFNLYPEVFVGGLYRVFHAILTDALGFKTKTCWTVNRGEQFPPVESCEGAGDRMYFYIHKAERPPAASQVLQGESHQARDESEERVAGQRSTFHQLRQDRVGTQQSQVRGGVL